MFEIQREELDWAGASSCSKPAASPARPTARFRDLGRNHRARHRRRRQGAEARRQDFFPLTVNYQEKAFAAGRIPGGYFKREGRLSDKRDADLPPDRPADPAAVPRWLPLRHAGHRHRAQPRPRERPRHSGADRRLGGADAVRRPFMGPIGARARRLHQRRDQGQPDDRGDEGIRRSISSSPAPPTRC